MFLPSFRLPRLLWSAAAALVLAFTASTRAQPAADEPMPYDADAKALALARTYLEGGPDARKALYEALDLMGWGIRDAKGAVLKSPPADSNTGLAMRDHEIEELLWNPSEQPGIRFISFAQAIAVPFEDADPEELAQDLLQTIRKSADSTQPQQRFWARFIVALGRVSPSSYDLLSPSPAAIIPPSKAQLLQAQKLATQDPFAMVRAMQSQPVWEDDDPVLAPSPLPTRADNDVRTTTPQRDNKRMDEIQAEISRLSDAVTSAPPDQQRAIQEKMNKLMQELSGITHRLQAASMQETAASMRKGQPSSDEEEEDEEEEDESEYKDASRFTAEWRDQPLSLLQVGLICRVLSADLRLAAAGKLKSARKPVGARTSRPLPLAFLALAQAPAPSLGDQISGAGADIWATAWGAYTGEVLEHHLPDNRFSKGVAIANTIIAWYKTIMSVARQKITIEVENAPLIRTKTRSPGEQRTARANVSIDFPKSDVLKALRAAMNLSTIDLQLPDGGPVSGAKVVWRLPEGSYNNKYQTAKGGWEYKPELAVVQFAKAGSNAAYISTTNEAGDATITIEGVPQRRNLPPSVRPFPRRAAVAVEVTIKVGNLTQDLNDAINTAMGGPIGGGLGFLADMVLRTSFFFNKSKPFPVTDWKEPAWEGEFEITVKGSGSEHVPGEKGGPPKDYTWSMDRYMEGRLLTPEWEEENEEKKNQDGDGRHKLEVDGDSRYFRLRDSSSERSRSVHNRYEATGPLQIQPPGHNQLARYSRSEPSGDGTLTFTGGKMILELNPFFGAECLVARSEQSGKRSSNKAGPEYLSLLNGVSPSGFTIIADNDGTQDSIEGTQTYDIYRGDLPYVPTFPLTVTVKYRLWKNRPPPINKAN